MDQSNNQEMPNCRNGAKLYGFTLKETSLKEEFLCPESYQHTLKLLRTKGEILELVYEDLRKDSISKARLHVHGIIDFDVIPRLTTLCPKGFSTKFEKIYNLKGWHKYCHKN